MNPIKQGSMDNNKLFTPIAFSPMGSNSQKIMNANTQIGKSKNNISKGSPKQKGADDGNAFVYHPGMFKASPNSGFQ